MDCFVVIKFDSAAHRRTLPTLPALFHLFVASDKKSVDLVSPDIILLHMLQNYRVKKLNRLNKHSNRNATDDIITEESSAVTLDHVTRTYKRDEFEVSALNDVTLDIPRKSFVAIRARLREKDRKGSP